MKKQYLTRIDNTIRAFEGNKGTDTLVNLQKVGRDWFDYNAKYPRL